jgi:hypothetical protein
VRADIGTLAARAGVGQQRHRGDHRSPAIDPALRALAAPGPAQRAEQPERGKHRGRGADGAVTGTHDHDIDDVAAGPREQDQQPGDAGAEVARGKPAEHAAEEYVRRDMLEVGMQGEGRERAPPLARAHRRAIDAPGCQPVAVEGEVGDRQRHPDHDQDVAQYAGTAVRQWLGGRRLGAARPVLGQPGFDLPARLRRRARYDHHDPFSVQAMHHGAQPGGFQHQRHIPAGPLAAGAEHGLRRVLEGVHPLYPLRPRLSTQLPGAAAQRAVGSPPAKVGAVVTERKHRGNHPGNDKTR